MNCHFLFLFYTSFITFKFYGCKNILSTRQYEHEEHHKLTSYLVNKKLSTIFVGSENSVFKLSTNLKKSDVEFVLTTEIYNLICSDESCSNELCNNDTATEKEFIKIRLRPVFANENLLIVCGFFNACIITDMNLQYQKVLCNSSSSRFVGTDSLTNYSFSSIKIRVNKFYELFSISTTSSASDSISATEHNLFNVFIERPNYLTKSEAKKGYNGIIYSFLTKDYIYNIINEDNYKGDSSFISRTCINNVDNTTVTIPIFCSLDSKDYEYVEYVAQDNNNLYFLIKYSSASYICYTKIDDIDKKMLEVIKQCYQKGQHFKELNYSDHSGGVTCVSNAEQSIDEESQCDSISHPIYGIEHLELNYIGIVRCSKGLSSSPPSSTISTLMEVNGDEMFVTCPDYIIEKYSLVTEPGSEKKSLKFLSTIRDVVDALKTSSLIPSPSSSSFSSSLPSSSTQSLDVIQMGAGLDNDILVLTENSLISMLKTSCARHTSCLECVNVPPCGWCLKNQKCTEKYDCSSSDKVPDYLDFAFIDSSFSSSSSSSSSLWLSKCYTVLNTFPNATAILMASNISFELELTYLPDPDSIECKATSEDVSVRSLNVPAQVTKTRDGTVLVKCSPFPYLPNEFLNRDDIQQGSLNLELLSENNILVTSKVTLFECKKFKSCSMCFLTNTCIWCPLAHICITKSEASNQCPSYDISKDVDASSFKCPTLLGRSSVGPLLQQHSQILSRSQLPTESQNFLIPAGTDTTIEIFASHLMDFQVKEGLYCIFDLLSFQATVTNHTTLQIQVNSLSTTTETTNLDEILHSPSLTTSSKESLEPSSVDNVLKITCHITISRDSIDQALTEMNLNLAWGKDKHFIENPLKLKAEVYDCLGMAESCGECLLLDPKYNCVFCEHTFCTDQCHGEFVKGTLSICSNPVINKLEPPGAPVNGNGSILTLHGINFPFELTDLYVKVGERICNFTKQTDLLFIPATRISCLLEPSAVETSVPVTLASKYSIKSPLDFIFKNPDLLSLHPIRGPRSGNTSVTINGNLLDFGSSAIVEINKIIVDIVWRNATELKFLTPPSTAMTQVNVDVIIDGITLPKSPEFVRFNYLDDPTVSTIDPKFSLISGGNIVGIRGSNLRIVQQPRFVVHVSDKHYIQTECRLDGTNSFLECPTPDLRNYISHVPAVLKCGLLMDGVKSIVTLDADKMIQYDAEPLIASFYDQPFAYDKQNNDVLYIEGENLLVLQRFTDLYVGVGGVACDGHKIINSTCIVCPLPDANKVILDEQGSAEVMVSLGNFKKVLGKVMYQSKYKMYMVIGIIIAIVIIISLIIIIVLLICFFKRKSRLKNSNKLNNFLLRPTTTSTTHTSSSSPPHLLTKNNYSAPSSSVPPHIIIDNLSNGQKINNDKDDATYLNEVLNRMESVRLRNVARNACIDYQQVQLLHLIGRGSFTRVHMATMKSPIATGDEGQTVCVKVIEEENMSDKMIDTLVRDASIMNNFRHEHVLVVMAICIGFHKEPWIVLPYMINGDLRTYVKDKSKNFTARRLLQLAQQVAGGMAYLSNLNFVHRELAARNCLLDDNLIVKVSDFGLTSELHEVEYFSNNASKFVRLPIKWMAIESLENFIFTTKSDVWSYGVLLWELMTRGVVPYPDVAPQQLTSFLNAGRRLKKPKYCPPNVYNMMNECWLEIPERRPTFTDLVNRLEVLLNPPKKKRRNPREEDEPLYINAHDSLSP